MSPSQTPVAGQQFEYAFNDIGNRTQTKAGGDQNGANLRLANYVANNLNQYTSRDVSGAFDVTGVELATNSVTVNSQTPYRKGEYFRKEISVSNGSVPVWQSVTVSAPNETTASGNVFVPKTAEAFGYDADGNLTSDGRWSYTWDAENRLIQLVANTGIGPQQLIRFEYDSKGRRIRKQVWPNTGGTGSLTMDDKFLYDEWNLVAELNATNNNLVRSFTWGLDLSGSLQGAGGVGGLLAVTYCGGSTTNAFAVFDGNGNVTALINAADGTTVAKYEYGPFGELLRATGSMWRRNALRFSTKYCDDETDFIYYGFRFYSPSKGVWLRTDPLDEESFAFFGPPTEPLALDARVNSLLFAYNNVINNYDYLGLACNVKPGTRIKVDVEGGGTAVITVGSLLNGPEQDAARRGLCLLNKLLPGRGVLPPFPDTHWGTFIGLPSQGFTYKGCVFIDSQLKPNCSPANKFSLATTLAHEAVHYYNPDIGDDPRDPRSPDNTINRPALDAFNKAVRDPVCGCCHGEWDLQVRFSLYACQCGLKPCKPSPCPTNH